MTDPISDMLTQIRNAYAVGRAEIQIDASKLKMAILSVLKEKGYIDDFSQKDQFVIIVLKYAGDRPAVTSVERVSKPGRRVYVKKDEIPRVLSGRGIAVISTPKGIMTGDKAKKNQLGGELICKVY